MFLMSSHRGLIYNWLAIINTPSSDSARRQNLNQKTPKTLLIYQECYLTVPKGTFSTLLHVIRKRVLH